MAVNKEKKKTIRKIIILGDDKKLINLVEDGLMESVEVYDSPESLYKLFIKSVEDKQEVDFGIISGTNESPYFFHVKGKSADFPIKLITDTYKKFYSNFAKKD